jgi:hypothetical protein
VSSIAIACLVGITLPSSTLGVVQNNPILTCAARSSATGQREPSQNHHRFPVFMVGTHPGCREGCGVRCDGQVAGCDKLTPARRCEARNLGNDREPHFLDLKASSERDDPIQLSLGWETEMHDRAFKFPVSPVEKQFLNRAEDLLSA